MNRYALVSLILILCLLSQATWAEGTRHRGIGHAPVVTGGYPYAGARRYYRQPSYGYWSKKCIRQRRSSLGSLGHTGDCDHPAYSGGYYPYGPPPPVIIIDDRGRRRR